MKKLYLLLILVLLSALSTFADTPLRIAYIADQHL